MKRAWVVALALTCWMAGARAATIDAHCGEIDGKQVCFLAESDLDAILAANQRAKEIIQSALARIKELEAEGPRPKCAEVEVVPKKLPPIPKEKTL